MIYTGERDVRNNNDDHDIIVISDVVESDFPSTRRVRAGPVGGGGRRFGRRRREYARKTISERLSPPASPPPLTRQCVTTISSCYILSTRGVEDVWGRGVTRNNDTTVSTSESLGYPVGTISDGEIITRNRFRP